MEEKALLGGFLFFALALGLPFSALIHYFVVLSRGGHGIIGLHPQL
jgi:hypothetical protein